MKREGSSFTLVWYGQIDFVLCDKSGRATVDSVTLALALDTDAEAHKHIIGRSTPGFIEFCGSLNIETWGQSLRMREGILEVGEAVTVTKADYRGQRAMLRVVPLESGETLSPVTIPSSRRFRRTLSSARTSVTLSA